MLCGACPIPASNGETTRHRLKRGGDRKANSALHMFVVYRMRRDARAKAYVARRSAAGSASAGSWRYLKRYVMREVYLVLLSGT